jgi:hypothetical protein
MVSWKNFIETSSLDIQDTMFASIARLLYGKDGSTYSDLALDDLEPELGALLLHENWVSAMDFADPLSATSMDKCATLSDSLSWSDVHRGDFLNTELAYQVSTGLYMTSRSCTDPGKRLAFDRRSRLPQVAYTRFFGIEKTRKSKKHEQADWLLGGLEDDAEKHSVLCDRSSVSDRYWFHPYHHHRVVAVAT